MIKIFAVNDCDWVAARSAEEALEFYMRDTRNDRATSLGYSDDDPEAATALPDELTPEDMHRLKFLSDDGPGTRITFREQLDRLIAAGQQFPVHFASTEQ